MLVIPTKVGLQASTKSKNWIPAYAGMTSLGGEYVALALHQSILTRHIDRDGVEAVAALSRRDPG